MRQITNNFLVWLMGLTRMMRYFVVAVLLHVVLLAVIGSIKIVAIVPKIVAQFSAVPPPPPNLDDVPDDPYAVYRDFEYNGPTLGGGGGTGGKGPGGVPTAGGGTPDNYTAHILTSSAEGAGETPTVGEVIGVFSDAATAVARPAGGPGGPALTALGGLGAAFGTGGIKGPGGGVLGARMGPQRTVAMQKYGASAATEKAVMAALRWLKSQQKEDGSWDMGSQPQAAASLAILTFLGHGETPDSAEFGPTVDKAIRYLISQVKQDGVVTGNMYVQGLTALALAEAYGMTQSPILRDPLDRAIQLIILAQAVPKENPLNKGGWRYNPNSNDADVSVAGWQVMALKSARNAGLEIPDQVFEDADEYLWNMYGNPGFGYAGPGSGFNTTGVGVLCQQFLGNGDDKRLKVSLDWLSKQEMDWNLEKGFLPLYGWYYVTQAMFQGGRSYWTSWNKQMQSTLLENQEDDGRWEVPGVENGHEKPLGPVYSTTLCTLMLEVYYRYLPMYQLTGGQAGDVGGTAGQTTGALPTINLPGQAPEQ